ncbi:MAG: immunoglobulin domain-containing protein, partial [Opitutaceae bacterium]
MVRLPQLRSFRSALLRLSLLLLGVGPLRAADPVITAPPASQRASVGSSASFSVQATGSAPLTYAWFKGTTPISGATSSLLVIPRLSLSDAGDYSVKVFSAAGEATAGPATLTVNPT